MEEKAPARRSVAELAGRFKAAAPSNDAAGNETDKPVRRRPPRSLHIPQPQAEEKEQPTGVTSPAPKAKRNSALIEKLQANLALSPTAMLPSPKSPGFKLVPPNFTPLSPGSCPVIPCSTATPTSPLPASPLPEEEGPVSFEDPLSVSEGSILSNINKGRVRHSLRRRPPSRRHRKSSSGDEVGVVSDVADPTVTSPSEPQGNQPTTGGGGEEEEEETGGKKEAEGEVFEKDEKTDEVKEKTKEVEEKTKEVEEKTNEVKEKTDSPCPEKNEYEAKSEPKGEEDKTKEENASKGEVEEEESSSGKQEEVEEEKSGEKQNEVSTDVATNTEKEEEETKETTS